MITAILNWLFGPKTEPSIVSTILVYSRKAGLRRGTIGVSARNYRRIITELESAERTIIEQDGVLLLDGFRVVQIKISDYDVEIYS